MGRPPDGKTEGVQCGKKQVKSLPTTNAHSCIALIPNILHNLKASPFLPRDAPAKENL